MPDDRLAVLLRFEEARKVAWTESMETWRRAVKGKESMSGISRIWSFADAHCGIFKLEEAHHKSRCHPQALMAMHLHCKNNAFALLWIRSFPGARYASDVL
ncbi:hypothetical protein [Cupriavidus necator]